MDWQDQIIAEVGQSMGVSGLDFSGTGVIRFEFETMGTLYMERQEDGVLMYLMRPIDPHNSLPILTQALTQCHFSKSIRFPLQVSLQGEQELFLCTFLDNENFNQPNVEGAMQYLSEQFNRIN